ncbi:MAG: VanZ family protein [Pseudomonadota bacterium]
MRPESLSAAIKGATNAWLPVAGYCTLLFIQSSFSAPELLPSFSGMDKLLHFGAYGVLGLLFMRAFTQSIPRLGARRIIFYSILLTTAYGLSDEAHQYFVVVRTADMMDVLADAMGGGCGTFLYCICNREVFASGGDR